MVEWMTPHHIPYRIEIPCPDGNRSRSASWDCYPVGVRNLRGRLRAFYGPDLSDNRSLDYHPNTQSYYDITLF